MHIASDNINSGLVKLSLAYSALSNKDFDSAAKYFNAAQHDSSLINLLKSVSANDIDINSDTNTSAKNLAPRVITANKPDLLAQWFLNNRKERSIKAKSGQGSEFKHCPAEDFYEDLLENDSKINSPQLVELNTDPDLPDVMPLYFDDDDNVEGYLDMGEPESITDDTDVWQEEPTEEEIAEQALADQEEAVAESLSDETDNQDIE